MKVEMHYKPSDLSQWILKTKLPDSLVAKIRHLGYGQYVMIYAKNRLPSIIDKLLELDGDPVAEIDRASIKLLYPEYYSDFDDLLRKYESETGVSTTLHVWQSEKDLDRVA